MLNLFLLFFYFSIYFILNLFYFSMLTVTGKYLFSTFLTFPSFSSFLVTYPSLNLLWRRLSSISANFTPSGWELIKRCTVSSIFNLFHRHFFAVPSILQTACHTILFSINVIFVFFIILEYRYISTKYFLIIYS